MVKKRAASPVDSPVSLSWLAHAIDVLIKKISSSENVNDCKVLSRSKIKSLQKDDPYIGSAVVGAVPSYGGDALKGTALHVLCLDWPHAISALILVVYGLHITFLFLKWQVWYTKVEKCQHEITCHLLIRSPAASRAAEKRGAARLGCTPPRHHATTPL